MHPDLQKIKNAAEGLLFMSESDYPFETISFSKASSPEQEIKKLSGNPNAAPEKITVDYFFRNMVKTYPGYSEEQLRTAERFVQLATLIKAHLSDPVVYRVGSTQVDAFIIGKLGDGSYGGLKTKLIET